MQLVYADFHAETLQTLRQKYTRAARAS